MQPRSWFPLLLLQLVLVPLLCVLPSSSVLGAEMVMSEPWDAEPFATPVAALLQAVSSLPATPDKQVASATKALKLVRALRDTELREKEAGRVGGLTYVDWSYRPPSVRITHAELETFPESLEMLPRFDGSVLDLDADADDEEGADDGADLDVKRIRPRLYRASLVHVLSMRGFDEALEAVLSFIPEGANRTETVNSGSLLSGSVRMFGATPLHLLAMYAPDSDSPSPSQSPPAHGNLVAAQLLLAAGANMSRSIDQQSDLTPLVFAAERGRMSLFRFLLDQRVRPSLGYTSFEQFERAPGSDEEKEYLVWLDHRRRILEQEMDGLPLLDEEGGLMAWADYLEWFESQRPLTAEEQANQQLRTELRRALELSVVANRLDVVRLLLEGPYDGYGLAGPEALNVRSHQGRGDTVLHGAVVHGLREMTELLLAHGADLSLQSHDSLTVLQLALQYKHLDLAAFLETKLKEARPPAKTVQLPEHASALERMKKAAEDKKKREQQEQQQQQQTADSTSTAAAEEAHAHSEL
jgi:ankyrin repeat protein